MNKMKVGVVGGGAAGLVAAITAVRNGAEVTILEAEARVGQKLLSTGNGKCNLGNLALDPTCYYSGDTEFVARCLSRFGTKDTLAFFAELGLLTRDKNGYLYPFCEQAGAVLDVLRNEASALRIRVISERRVTGIKQDSRSSFLVQTGNECFSFDRVILCCGGKAAPKTGSDGSGYRLAKELGHKVVPVVPALTFLKCEGDYFKAIAGVRTQARISLQNDRGELLAGDQGELQLTEQGLSGIPIFQICRVAAYALREGKRVWAEVDYLPQISEEELKRLAEKRLPLQKNRTLEEFMTGILNKKIMQLLIKRAGLKGTAPASVMSLEKLESLLFEAKHFKTEVVGTGDFQHAQVCAGGVELSQITDDFESKRIRGLYFAGELLDVDGKCGGYNLQWAWTSGFLAGNAASRTV